MANKVSVIGELLQTSIAGKRFYRAELTDGNNKWFRHLRSVTTFNKGAKTPSFLDEWIMMQCQELGVQGYKDTLNSKAHDGEVLHKFIENHINGEKIDRRSLAEIKVYEGDGFRMASFAFDDDTWAMFQAYLVWEEKYKPKWVFTEKTLFSLQYGYAGRSDGCCIIDGKTYIIDFKSAKAVRDEHKMQGVAYLIAGGEMEMKIDGIIVLCLGADENRKQPYSQSIITDPYKICQLFIGFTHKINLVNWDDPVFI